MNKMLYKVAPLLLIMAVAFSAHAQRTIPTLRCDNSNKNYEYILVNDPNGEANSLILTKVCPGKLKPAVHRDGKGAKAANVSVSVNAVPDTVFISYNKNEDCHHYYSLIMEHGSMDILIEIYAMYGITVNVEDLVRMYAPEEGTLFFSDTTEVVTNLTPATQYNVYTWALANEDDTIGVISSTAFTSAVGGGTGTAAVSIAATTDRENIYFTATPNDQTGYYRIAFADSATLARNHWNADSMAAQAAEVSPNYSGVIRDTITDLMPGKQYVLFAFPYNHNEECGTVATDTVRTEGTLPGGTGLATMTMSLTNFTSTSVNVNITKGDQTAYYYLLFAQTAVLQQNGIDSEDEVAAVCEEGGDRYYENISGKLTGLNNGTEMMAWGLPYNRNEERGTCVSYTFVVGQGIIGIDPAEAISVAVYPNPVQNVLSVVCNEQLRRAELFNAFGTQVYGQNLAGNSADIIVSDLPRGIYLLRLYGQNSVSTRKVVLK
ncbi:MAG: T9SS type A sorting domain-containing protein [Bacteroidales bacterium]|nr:T9SS type A sorting domain-containing protein [Bacteroidales bacterium]